jgi:hypothetical protein
MPRLGDLVILRMREREAGCGFERESVRPRVEAREWGTCGQNRAKEACLLRRGRCCSMVLSAPGSHPRSDGCELCRNHYVPAGTKSQFGVGLGASCCNWLPGGAGCWCQLLEAVRLANTGEVVRQLGFRVCSDNEWALSENENTHTR